MSSSSRSNTPTLIQRATEVDEYYKFSLEDTAEGCYRDFCSYLQDIKGWKRMPLKKRSKVQSKLPLRKDEVPLLYCVLNERDVDFNSLQAHQVCNHFEGMGRTLTTKSGFCDLLREMNWSMVDANTIAPRSYNLGDPVQREEFVDDFKLSAAVNILKYVLHTEVSNDIGVSLPSYNGEDVSGIDNSRGSKKRSSSNSTTIVTVPSSVLKNAIKVSCRYLRVKVGGEWPGVDKDFKADGKSNILDQNQWTELMETSYKIADRKGFVFNFTNYIEKEHLLLNSSSNVDKKNNVNIKIWLILKAMYNLNNHQMCIDGTKNIWIIKAPEACKGVGIKLLYKLHDILDCEKGMGGRTAQKYIENPLLVPLSHKSNSHLQNISPRDVTCVSPVHSSLNNSISVKFDLRVWVMVTSVTPLKVKIYSKVYGRCCCTQYNDDLPQLTDTSMHLTNFAIQKNHVYNNNNNNNDSVTDENSGNDNTNSSNSNVNSMSNYGIGVTGMLNRIRASMKKMSGDKENNNNNNNSNTCNGSSSSSRENCSILFNRSDLLLTHDDVVKIIASASNVDKTWDDDVWPDIKNKIMQTLQAVCCSGNVTQREKSFEFLGFDVMLDNNLTPWILEVNMSPALAHRGGKHSNMIAHMATGIVDTAILTHTGTPSLENLQSMMPQQRTFQGSSRDIIFEEETLLDSPTELETNDSIHSSNDTNVDLGEWHDLHIEDKTCLLPPYLVRNLISEGICEKSSSLSGKSSRPASAGKIRLSQKNNSLKSNTPDWDDVQYTATKSTPSAPIEIIGKIMTKPNVQIIDRNLDILERMMLIQAWFRRYLKRTRQYHKKRHIASVLVQRYIRGFLGKSRLWHLKRETSSVLIQCIYRCRLAIKKRELLKRHHCALTLQCGIRIHQAKKKMYNLLINAKALIIQMFLIKSIDRWYRRAAKKIAKGAKIWCMRRWSQARKVRNIIILYYRRRSSRARVIQHFSRRCFVRWRLFDVMKKMKLKSLSEEAAVVVEKKREHMLQLLREEELQMIHIREDVLYLMDDIITTIEKKNPDDKKERMSCDNSGFLYEFVDRYESDRKRLHETLPHTIKNIISEQDTTGYEFENAPPTSVDTDEPINFGVSFAVEKTGYGNQVGVALEVNRRAQSSNNSNGIFMSHLSRIGADVIDKKVKEKARDQASSLASRKTKRQQIMRQFNTDDEKDVCGFIALQELNDKTKENKKRPTSASRYRCNNEEGGISSSSIPKPSKTEKKKPTKKKKSKSRGPVINVFDSGCPPDFFDFPTPPSFPSSRPSNIPRPEPKNGYAKENSRPFSRSSPANRRSDFILSHKKDYLEALHSLHDDLDMAAKHYSHQSISSQRYNEEEYVREPLSPLHLSKPRDNKQESPPLNNRPEFIVNRRDHENDALKRMKEKELEKKRDTVAPPVARPRSASAVKKPSHSSKQHTSSNRSSSSCRPTSANRRPSSANIQTYDIYRSDVGDKIPYDEEYIEKNILGVKENGCIFPGIRNSFDFSAFEPPSLDEQIRVKQKDDMGKPPIVPLKKNNGSYQYEKELKQVLFRIA